MAIEKQINIVVKETGLDAVNKKVNQLDTSLDELQTTQKGVAKSMGESSNAVLDNGGAMGLLNDATGGLAMTVKDAVEASVLFTKSQKLAAIGQAFYTTVIGTSTGAIKLFRIALVSTGIGAIVVGIGLLIANFDKVKKAVLNLVPGLAVIGDLFTGLVETVGDFIGVTSEAERAMADLTEQADKSLATNKKFMEEQGDLLNDYTKAKIDAKNKYLEAIKVEGADQVALAKRLNRELEAVDKKRNDDLAKTRKDAQDKIDDEERKAKDKRDAKNQKITDEEKAKAQKLIDEATSIKNKAIEESNARSKTELELLEEKYLAEKTLLESQGIVTENLQNEYWNKQNELLLKQQSIEYDINQKGKDDKKAQDKEAGDKEIEIAQRVLAQKKELQNAQINLASSTIGLLSQIAGKNKTLQKAAIIADSALGIGKSIIATNASNIAATAEGAALAIPTAGASVAAAASLVTLNNVALGVGIASNLIATKKALSALGGGSAGGGEGAKSGSAPSAPSFNLVQGTGTNQIAQGLAGSDRPIRAYVTSSEVTSRQALDRNIVENASL